MLGHLRVFDTFCRSGSVTRAAAMLHVTPGAVSQQLKQLENMLGIRLFNKSGRLLEPAPLAKVLAARLAELFDRIENALVDAAAVSRKKRLRIVVSPDFATKWLMPKLTAFLVALPDVDLDIATSARMEDHRLDNADFTTRNGNGQWDDVRADLVFDDVLVPVCAPEIAETIKSPRDFLQHRWIHSMRRPDAWQIWSDFAGLPGEAPERSMELADLGLCIEAAAAGLGIALTQRAYLDHDLANGRVVPCDFTAHTGFGLYLIRPIDDQETSPAKEFRQWLLEAARPGITG